MKTYKVKLINKLFDFPADSLIKGSKEEGFLFIERLRADYKYIIHIKSPLNIVNGLFGY